MFRACLVIFVLHLCFTLQGCGVLEYLDDSPDEEIRYFRMSKGEMQKEMEKLNIENTRLKSQITALKRENQRIETEKDNEISKLRDQMKLLSDQISKVKEEKQKIGDENKIFAKQRLTPHQLNNDIGQLKIKVLSGNGDLNSALNMAQRLKKMAYKITRIDSAPRSNFSRNTVFFARNVENQGRRLVASLGGQTICKPLSWHSAFDLIVVTGKNP